MLELGLKEQKQINGGRLVFIVHGTDQKGKYHTSRCYTVSQEENMEDFYRSLGYTNIGVTTVRE